MPVDNRYHLFVSHSSTDREVSRVRCHLRKFIAEIESLLARKLGLGKVDRLCFIDERCIECGDEWRPALSDAARTARALVCFVSPNYLQSEWCGKELQVFLDRQSRMQTNSSSQKKTWIFPILWESFSASTPLPERLSAFQLCTPDRSGELKSRGFSYYRRCGSTEQKNRYVESLADLFAGRFEDTPDGLESQTTPLMLQEVANAFKVRAAEQPYGLQLILSPRANRILRDRVRESSFPEVTQAIDGSVTFADVRPEGTGEIRRTPLFVVTVEDDEEGIDQALAHHRSSQKSLKKPPLIQITSTSESGTPALRERWARLMSEFELMSCPADSVAEFIQKHAVRLRRERIAGDCGVAAKDDELRRAADDQGIPVKVAPILSFGRTMGTQS